MQSLCWLDQTSKVKGLGHDLAIHRWAEIVFARQASQLTLLIVFQDAVHLLLWVEIGEPEIPNQSIVRRLYCGRRARAQEACATHGDILLEERLLRLKMDAPSDFPG